METHGTSFALLVLLSWPLISLCIYLRIPAKQATVWTILGGQLLLPAGGASIKIAMLPILDKSSIAAFSAFLGCMLFAKRGTALVRRSKLALLLIVCFTISPLITSLLNTDWISIGGKILPGTGLYDGGSAAIAQLVALLPFFLARVFLADSSDPEVMLRALLIALLVYSLPMLYEIRFSPQLHNIVYGYHATEFIQQVRAGGYRPVVFTGHGLTLAMFASTATIAAAAFLRSRKRSEPIRGSFAYLGVLTLLCKSAGAIVYTTVLAPLVYFAKPRFQVRIAAVVVSIVLMYPALRASDVLPIKFVLDFASSFSAERAGSLEFRIVNEQLLLERASDRILFGWGRFGRNRVYDPETGKDIAVTDGGWIITLGSFGLFGYGAFFGLLSLPVLLFAKAVRYSDPKTEAIYLAALSLVAAIWILDQVPNSGILPWVWLLLGCLLGRSEALLTRRGLEVRSSSKSIPSVRQLNLGFKTGPRQSL